MTFSSLRKTINRLLLWSQKYTKTNMLYAAKGGFWLSANQITTSTLGFVLSIAFARLLPPENYGQYRYLLSLAEIFSAFSLSGMATALTQAVGEGQRGILSRSFWIHMKWCIPMSVGSLIGAAYYLVRGNTTLGISLLFITITLPFIKSGGLWEPYVQGKKLFKKNAIYQALRYVVYVLILFLLMLTTDNVVILVCGYLMSNAIMSLLLYGLAKRQTRGEAPQDLPTTVLSYAKHLSLMNVLGIAAAHLDKIIVFQFLGAAELAIYSFATVLPEQVRNYLKRLPILALPTFADRTLAEVKRSVFYKMKILLPFLGVCVLVYCLLAPFVYRLFFPAYVEAVPYSQLYSLSFLSYASLAIVALTAHKAVKEKYIHDMTANVATILFALVLVIPYGIWGVLVGRLLAKALSFILSAYLLQRLQDKTRENT